MGIIQMTQISLCIIDAHIKQPQLVKTYRKAVNSHELMRSLKSQVTVYLDEREHYPGIHKLNKNIVFLNA